MECYALRHLHISPVPLRALRRLITAACGSAADAVRLRVGRHAIHGDAGGDGTAVVEEAEGSGVAGGDVAAVVAHPGTGSDDGGATNRGRPHIAAVVAEVDGTDVEVIARNAARVGAHDSRATGHLALVVGVEQGVGAVAEPQRIGGEGTGNAARAALLDLGSGGYGNGNSAAVHEIGRGGDGEEAHDAARVGRDAGMDTTGHRTVVGTLTDGRLLVFPSHAARDAAGVKCRIVSRARRDDGPADGGAVGTAGHGGGVCALPGDATQAEISSAIDADAFGKGDGGAGGGGATGDAGDVVALNDNAANTGDADNAAHVAVGGTMAQHGEVTAEMAVLHRNIHLRGAYDGADASTAHVGVGKGALHVSHHGEVADGGGEVFVGFHVTEEPELRVIAAENAGDDMSGAVEVPLEGIVGGADGRPVEVVLGGDVGAVYLDVTDEAVVGRSGGVTVGEAAALVDVLHQPVQVRVFLYQIGIVGGVLPVGIQEHGYIECASHNFGIYNVVGGGQLPVAVNRHIVHLPRDVVAVGGGGAARIAVPLGAAGVGVVGAGQGEDEVGVGHLSGLHRQICHELAVRGYLRHVGESESEAVGRPGGIGIGTESTFPRGSRQVEADGGVGFGHGDDEAEERADTLELEIGIGERADSIFVGKHVIEVAQVAGIAVAALHLSAIGVALL